LLQNGGVSFEVTLDGEDSDFHDSLPHSV
jgi:hypothetical protein